MKEPALITRRLEFDAGHRLVGHEGKCASVHGHRYVAEITCSAEQLDDVGRVIDFSVVKSVVGGWIDSKWDHAFLVQSTDKAMVMFLVGERQKYWVCIGPPTVEVLTRELYEVAGGLLAPYGVRVQRVKMWETPNCSAEVSTGSYTALERLGEVPCPECGGTTGY